MLMQNAIAKMIQKPREPNGGLEVCISFQLMYSALFSKMSRLNFFVLKDIAKKVQKMRTPFYLFQSDRLGDLE